jgi:hypothetical protein
VEFQNYRYISEIQATVAIELHVQYLEVHPSQFLVELLQFTQQSLGLSWDLHSDKFIFRLNDNEKPATRRGLLSTINSIFDPLGFIYVEFQNYRYISEIQATVAI